MRSHVKGVLFLVVCSAITHRADAAPGMKPRQVDLIGHMV